MAFVLTLILVFSLVPGVVFADVGDVPEHSKLAKENGDGTYKIELTVTGDADDDTQEAGNVNVLIIYDTSSSMTSNAQGSSYSRADQAEDVVHDFLASLAGHQNTAKDNISVALVTFAVSTDQHNEGQTWTTDVSALADRFDDGGTNRQTKFSYSGGQSNGTNWEAALVKANGLLESAPGNGETPTFVIMMTDGACTASGNGANAVSPTGATFNQLRTYYEAAIDDALTLAQACQGTGGTFYGIYAYGTEADLLDDLMYYSVEGTERSVSAETVDAPNFFLAANTDDLNAAITKIFNQVLQALGISSVSISDGTTNQVQTSTGEISELLEVDENSYQYWLSIPVVDNAFTRKMTVTEDGTSKVVEVSYKVTDNGDGTCKVEWTEGSVNKSVTVSGSVSSGQFKYEWTEKNDLYSFDPPAAKLNNGAVDWDLSPVGTLLDGVTYSVTFNVYPSQTTLDIVADIKNDPGETGAWAKLDSEIQKYIDVNGNLETNTTATLSWEDTRPGGKGGSTTYVNPDPVESSAVEQLAVTKKWENELDKAAATSVKLTVTRDGDDTYEVELNNENDWNDSVFISIGIMKDGKVLAGSEGHDFTFTEPQNLSYHWELDVPVVHPMLMDGELTMLVKVDDKHQPEEGAETYTIGDNKYYIYVPEDGEAQEVGVALTAVNRRRSSLLLTKVVDGEDVPEDAEFPFTLTIENSLAPEKEPENDLSSDYWVWISVRDMSETDDPDKAPPVNDAVVSGATPEDGSNGWYYAPSGKPVVINMKAGYSIRVNNLPTDSTYTITEGELPIDFTFESAELVIADGEGADSTFKGGQTTTGTIEETNTLYKVVYTNSYESTTTSVTVTKEWKDNSDKYKVRPANLPLTLNGAPEGFKVPDPTVTEDGDKWTYKWTGLPKTDDKGEAITYTVTEEKAPVGYVMSGSPAKDGGTITNTFEPCIGDPPVKKVITGDKPEKAETFTFKLTAASTTVEEMKGAMPMPEAAKGAQFMTVTVTGEGTTEFGEIYFVEPGEYTYEITEEAGSAEGYTYSKEKHTIVYTVTTDSDNSLKCVKKVDGVEITGKEKDEANVSKFVFTNEYKKPAEPEKETVDVKVSKTWKDDNNADLTRPSSVTVKLLADGKDTGKTIELSKATEWAGVFEGLDKYSDSDKEIKYTVEEVKVPEGYEAKVEGDMSKGFNITNSLVKEEDVPPTGDTSDIFFWSGLSMTSLLGLGYLFLKRRKEEQ